jgi:putative DNA primase/helicase
MTPAKAWDLFTARGDMIPRGENFLVKCPGHEDKTRSLSIRLKEDDGGVIVKCFAGCKIDDIAKGLDCRVADFFSSSADKYERKAVIANYVYQDERGVPLYRVQRTDPKGFYQQRWKSNDGCDRWLNGLGDVRRVLYHLPQLLASDRPVVIVEGEKDVENVEKLGFIATTVSGGVEGWRSVFADVLRGRICILIPDNDEPGRQFSAHVATFLPMSVGVQLPGLQPKQDISDWIAAGGTAAKLRDLVRQSARDRVTFAMSVAIKLGAVK